LDLIASGLLIDDTQNGNAEVQMTTKGEEKMCLEGLNKKKVPVRSQRCKNESLRCSMDHLTVTPDCRRRIRGPSEGEPNISQFHRCFQGYARVSVLEGACFGFDSAEKKRQQQLRVAIGLP